MASQPANSYASASPLGSPQSSPTKLKLAPPALLTILQLAPQRTNFQLRARVDDIGTLREFRGGPGVVMRTVLSDDGASVTAVAFNLVAKHVVKVLKVGQTYLFSKCIVKPQYGGGRGIEVQFNEQTAFVEDQDAIIPTSSSFADIATANGIIHVKATILNIHQDIAYFGCLLCNVKNHQDAQECGRCQSTKMAWRLKLAVTVDDGATSKDLTLWENQAKQLVGDMDVSNEDARDHTQDICQRLVGDVAMFKLQIRQNDDQAPNLTCLGVQLQPLEQQGASGDEDGEIQDEKSDDEEPPPEPQVMIPPRTTQPKRLASTLVLQDDVAPPPPPPPHAARLTKSTSSIHTPQQLRPLAKAATKKTKSSK